MKIWERKSRFANSMKPTSFRFPPLAKSQRRAKHCVRDKEVERKRGDGRKGSHGKKKKRNEGGTIKKLEPPAAGKEKVEMEKKEGEGGRKKGVAWPPLVLLVFPSSPYFAAMPFPLCRSRQPFSLLCCRRLGGGRLSNGKTTSKRFNKLRIVQFMRGNIEFLT